MLIVLSYCCLWTAVCSIQFRLELCIPSVPPDATFTLRGYRAAYRDARQHPQPCRAHCRSGPADPLGLRTLPDAEVSTILTGSGIMPWISRICQSN